jgi:hypothetical protein
VSILVAALTFMSPMTAFAYSVNFDGYAGGTPAESLTEVGVTFTSDVAGDWIIGMPAAFANLTGQGMLDVACVGNGLTIDFAQPQGSVGFDFGTIANFSVNVTAYYQGNMVDSGSFSGTVIVTFPEGYATVSAPQIDSVYVSAPDCWVFDNLVTTPATATAPSGYPKIGQVRVEAPGSPLYESAGGGVVRNASGSEIWVPNPTAPDPEYDVYDVIQQVEIDGQTWVQIFIGNTSSFVWLPVGGNVSAVY